MLFLQISESFDPRLSNHVQINPHCILFPVDLMPTVTQVFCTGARLLEYSAHTKQLYSKEQTDCREAL